MKLYVQYMVSLRCKMKVEEVLEQLEIPFRKVELGVIELQQEISKDQLELVKSALAKSGLLIIDDKRSILIEKIRITIIEMIHHSEDIPKVNNSDFISETLGYDYTYLSNIFSETLGITIQQFVIIHKIEKVKELLIYDELNISEIALRMNYSSTAHLSRQFKKITGLTPSYYKQLKRMRVGYLENL